jgi:SAM-dependent methyltransferase
MSLSTALRRRHLQPEVMDRPDLPGDEHFRALRGLERINWWTNSAGLVWGPIRELARAAGPLRVLDLATGAGDTPISLARRAARAGLRLDVTGCDLSPRAVEYATRAAARRRAAVRFFTLDALNDPLPPDYDVLFCSLFLHHLTEDQAVLLLGRMAAARRLVLVHDLARGLPGFLFAYLGTRLLSRSKVVHEDGRKSVEGAFTPGEVAELAARAGLSGARVEARFPCRLVLTWQAPDAGTGAPP